ncbi:MAG: hypothetical protein ACRCS9_09135 [Hyphomicrobium sp.]
MFDVMTALTWFAIGAIVGAIVAFVIRRMFGGDDRLVAQLNSTSGELSDNRSAVAKLVQEKIDLEANVMSLNGRAAIADQLERDREVWRRTDKAQQDELANAGRQIATMRRDLEDYQKAEAQYEVEFDKLINEFKKLTSISDAKNAEMDKLVAEFNRATAQASDTSRQLTDAQKLRPILEQARAESMSLKNEVSSLKKALADRDEAGKAAQASLAKLASDFDAKSRAAGAQMDEIARLKHELSIAQQNAGETQKLKAAIAEHKSDLEESYKLIEDGEKVEAELKGTIERLEAKLARMTEDAANYQRFKEALEAANRIAGGR